MIFISDHMTQIIIFFSRKFFGLNTRLFFRKWVVSFVLRII